jgi:hypothetical protein
MRGYENKIILIHNYYLITIIDSKNIIKSKFHKRYTQILTCKNTLKKVKLQTSFKAYLVYYSQWIIQENRRIVQDNSQR